MGDRTLSCGGLSAFRDATVGGVSDDLTIAGGLHRWQFDRLFKTPEETEETTVTGTSSPDCTVQ